MILYPMKYRIWTPPQNELDKVLKRHILKNDVNMIMNMRNVDDVLNSILKQGGNKWGDSLVRQIKDAYWSLVHRRRMATIRRARQNIENLRNKM